MVHLNIRGVSSNLDSYNIKEAISHLLFFCKNKVYLKNLFFVSKDEFVQFLHKFFAANHAVIEIDCSSVPLNLFNFQINYHNIFRVTFLSE